jgi:hypothetical protein
MAHERLGASCQARTWYDKAVQAMAGQAGDPELARFRAEAEALLRVKHDHHAKGQHAQGAVSKKPGKSNVGFTPQQTLAAPKKTAGPRSSLSVPGGNHAPVSENS